MKLINNERRVTGVTVQSPTRTVIPTFVQREGGRREWQKNIDVKHVERSTVPKKQYARNVDHEKNQG